MKDEVLGFARNYNDAGLIGRVLRQSKADKEYYDAARAWEEGDYGRFIDQFFLAIHSRYDIEKPASKRLFRLKLNHFNALREENERLKEALAAREKFLEKLATEYFVMGKECESEGLTAAAIKNYRKALELRPDYAKAQRRIYEETVASGSFSAVLTMDTIPPLDFFHRIDTVSRHDTCWQIEGASYVYRRTIKGTAYTVSLSKESKAIRYAQVKLNP